MRVRLKYRYRATIRAAFISVGHRWLNSRFRRNSWALFRLLTGSTNFLMGSSVRRTLLEANLLALALFWLTGADPVLIDYRLLAIQYLPGGLLANLWATFRLRKLAPRGPFKKTGLTIIFGLGLNLLVVSLAFVLALFKYPLAELASPGLLDLFGNPSNAVSLTIFTIVDPLLSWPYQFNPTTPTVWIVFGRIMFYTFELGLLFWVMRSFAGLLAIPGRRIKAMTERRLLWRLTFSHFSVVLIALIAALAMVITAQLVFSARGQRSQATGSHDIAAFSARGLAETIRLEKLSSPFAQGELDTFLRQLTANPFEPGEGVLNPLNPPARVRVMLDELKVKLTGMPDNINNSQLFWTVAVTDPGGTIQASSSPLRLPVGKPFVESVIGRNYPALWTSLLGQAATGNLDLQSLMITRARPTMLIGGAYPVLNRLGQVESIVFISQRPELAVIYSGQGLISLLGLGAVVLVAGFTISLTTVFVALLFGFLLSRRLVRNLENLTTAADALAAGNLTQRVSLDGHDEINRLAARFNLMAYRLQQSQTSLEQEKRKAEQALKYKRDLVANVSHELRTPVTTIRAHIDWLLQQAEQINVPASADSGSDSPLEPQELYNYLDIIGRETQRLSALIEDLLDLSRIETGGQTLQLAPVEVATLVTNVQQALGLMAQRERKIKITLDLAPGLPPILADRQRLEQVLLNLTRNAINYTPAGGIISIGAAQTGPAQVALWVADTGIGIAPDELQQVFERFYRSDTSRSRNTGGAGLGLAIVKTLVEAMNGTIEVESVLGEGSKFTVTLPVLPPKIPAAPTGQLKNKNIV